MEYVKGANFMKMRNKGRAPGVLILFNIVVIAIILCSRYDIISRLQKNHLQFTEKNVDTKSAQYNIDLSIQCDRDIMDKDYYVGIIEDELSNTTPEVIARAKEFVWYIDTDLESGNQDYEIIDDVDQNEKEIHIVVGDSFQLNVQQIIQDYLK